MSVQILCLFIAHFFFVIRFLYFLWVLYLFVCITFRYLSLDLYLALYFLGKYPLTHKHSNVDEHWLIYILFAGLCFVLKALCTSRVYPHCYLIVSCVCYLIWPIFPHGPQFQASESVLWYTHLYGWVPYKTVWEFLGIVLLALSLTYQFGLTMRAFP